MKTSWHISLSIARLLLHPWFRNVVVLYVLGYCPSGLV